MSTITLKYIETTAVTDPDSELLVNVMLFKTSTGAMVGIDESFISNTDEPMYSPYDVGVQMEETDDTYKPGAHT